MQIDKDAFINALAGSILCPSDMKIKVEKSNKVCCFSVDCKRCWDEALENENSIELVGGKIECQ